MNRRDLIHYDRCPYNRNTLQRSSVAGQGPHKAGADPGALGECLRGEPGPGRTLAMEVSE